MVTSECLSALATQNVCNSILHVHILFPGHNFAICVSKCHCQVETLYVQIQIGFFSGNGKKNLCHGLAQHGHTTSYKIGHQFMKKQKR